jgi:hypothetical protein
VIRFRGRVFKARVDIFRFKVGVVFEDFLLGDFGGEEIEHILYADTHSPDARTSSALLWIESDSPVHGGMVFHLSVRVKFADGGSREDDRTLIDGHRAIVFPD